VAEGEKNHGPATDGRSKVSRTYLWNLTGAEAKLAGKRTKPLAGEAVEPIGRYGPAYANKKICNSLVAAALSAAGVIWYGGAACSKRGGGKQWTL
jgi:hypothetical protein